MLLESGIMDAGDYTALGVLCILALGMFGFIVRTVDKKLDKVATAVDKLTTTIQMQQVELVKLINELIRVQFSQPNQGGQTTS